MYWQISDTFPTFRRKYVTLVISCFRCWLKGTRFCDLTGQLLRMKVWLKQHYFEMTVSKKSFHNSLTCKGQNGAPSWPGIRICNFSLSPKNTLHTATPLAWLSSACVFEGRGAKRHQSRWAREQPELFSLVPGQLGALCWWQGCHSPGYKSFVKQTKNKDDTMNGLSLQLFFPCNSLEIWKSSVFLNENASNKVVFFFILFMSYSVS